MDLKRIDYIKKSSSDALCNPEYLKGLLPKLGFNTELLREQPEIVKKNGGGLLIWQYPNQFSYYLALLQKQTIKSYIEIGCRWGGTFIVTHEYLKRFNSMDKSVAIDIIDSPVNTYCKQHKETEFIKIDSRSPEFHTYIKNNHFDLIFIDGNHTYEGIKHDYDISKDHGKIFVFHDIASCVCPGLVKFWQELKTSEKEQYDFFEFIDQYPDVFAREHKNFLGIGVAIKKRS